MTRNKIILLMISATLWSFVFSKETDLTTDSPSEFSPRTVQTGRLVVRIGDEGEENDRKKVQSGLSDDAKGHQSDSQATAGSYKAAETKLRHLNPSVHCGDDSMALRIQGYRVPNFMVDRGGEGVIPVSQLPDNCGISTKRVRRDLLVVVQYKGCDVTQKGDDYVLPLRLWGAPVSMSCPVSSTNVTADQPVVPDSGPTEASTPVPSTEASTASTVPASDSEPNWYQIPYHQEWRPFYPYRHFWPGHMGTPTGAPAPAPSTEAPTPDPTTAAPTIQADPVSDPQQEWYQFGYFPHHHKHPFYPYKYYWPGHTGTPTGAPAPAPTTRSPAPTPTTAASTAQADPASDPQQEWYQFGYFPHHHKHPFYPYRYYWPGHTGTPTGAPAPAPTTLAPAPAPTTAASTAQADPASDPQQEWYQFGYFQHHHKHPFYPYIYYWPGHTHTPTAAPATFTEAQTPVPTTVAPAPALTPSSTAQAVPASDPQQEWFPFGYFPHHHKHPFYPYRYFWPGHIGAPTGAPAPAPSTEASTPASTTAASTAQAVPASDPQQYGYAGTIRYHDKHPFYPFGYSWPGSRDVPSTAPSTSVPARDPGQPPLPVKYGQKPLYYRHHLRPGTLPCNKVPFWTRC